MSERRYDVRTYGADYLCDKCETPMVAENRVLTSSPPQYPHRCPKCDFKINLRERYPVIRHERVEGW